MSLLPELPAKICRVILHLLTIAFSLTIIIVTAEYLARQRGKSGKVVFTCLLDGFNGVRDDRVCGVAYTIAGVSLVASVLILALTVLGLLGFYISATVDGFLSIFLAAWWFAGAVALTVFVVEANRRRFPRMAARNLILALSYLNFFFFFLNIWTSLTCGLHLLFRKRRRRHEHTSTYL